MTSPTLKTWYFLGLMGIAHLAGAAVLTGTDETARLPFWEWNDHTVSVRLVQRLPDQSRAFFAARKFSPSDAERIAQSCVFQTVFKNLAEASSNTVIRYDLNEWHISHNGTQRKLKVKEQWMAEWQQSQAPKNAQIAFSWSLLPTRQQYQPGDYNWGMTTFNLPPGQRFELTLVWYENAQPHSAVIPNIECAPDVEINPPNGISN
jgi:hypothetical protein